MSHIKYPFGFQVLQKNHRAIKCFELILNKFKITYEKKHAKDNGIEVYKYRLKSHLNTNKKVAKQPS